MKLQNAGYTWDYFAPQILEEDFVDFEDGELLPDGPGYRALIDILEVGTPVITKEGLVPVYHVKLRYPNLCVFADTNIIDGEAMECEDACKAHADIVM